MSEPKTTFVAELKTKATYARKFLMHDLWVMELRQVPKVKRAGLGLLRIVQIVILDFVRDKCALRAASLTYITLMSMVPLLAMAFSVAKGLGAQKKLMEAMDTTMKGLPEQVSGFIVQVFGLVEKTDFVALGAVGSVLLFYTVIKVMGQIEGTFNDIWGIKKGRTLMRKFTDYTSVLVVVPFLVIVAFTLNATLESKKATDFLEDAVEMRMFEDDAVEPEIVVPTGGQVEMATTGQASEVDVAAVPQAQLRGDQKSSLHVRVVVKIYRLCLRFTGILGIAIGFSFLYMFLPNTKVKWQSALIGGLFAGLLWLGWQWACINVQMIVTKWNKIYGAFATLPISLFWLNVNWMITLLGAEISFAVQNYQTYILEVESANMSHATRRRLGFLLVFDICRAFRAGEEWMPEQYQEAHNIPIRLIHDVLDDVEEDHVVVRTADGGFVPGKDIGRLTLEDVETALSGKADQRSMRMSERISRRLVSLLGDHEKEYRRALDTRTFADLLDEPDGEPVAAESDALS